jgi:hypothetical protein
VYPLFSSYLSLLCVCVCVHVCVFFCACLAGYTQWKDITYQTSIASLDLSPYALTESSCD